MCYRPILIGLCAAGGWWVTGETSPAADGNPAAGRSVDEKHCLACHGPSGKSDGPTGNVIAPPAADLTAPVNRKKTDTQLLGIIENGKPGTAMMAWKERLSNQDMRNVVAYVRTLGK